MDYEKILAEMTLEEKASMCSGLTFWKTQPIKRLGVPSVMVTDGPNGIRKEKKTAGTNIMQIAEKATCYPPECTVANSWDTDLTEEMGKAIAEEAKAMGVSTVLGPGVNIKRSPMCGRNFEYYSEDPYLSGRMGAAFVRGVQKNGVGVSVKHFCANNQEFLRMSIDTIVDERTLREIYLPAFEYIVKTEKPTTVMSSYNQLNGTFMSDNKRLLTDILRKEWGFDGIVMSDWGGMHNRVKALVAGNDLEMPGNKGFNDKKIVKAVKNGTISEADLDKAVLRLLKFAYEAKEREEEALPSYEKHNEVARKVAENSAVLLKNEGVLPLREDKSVALIGLMAKKARYQGSGSSHINPTRIVSIFDAFSERGVDFTFAKGYKLQGDGYKKSLIKQAVEVAKTKDVAVVVVGLTDAYESEGFDRSHINMPPSHSLLINEIAKVNPNVVVVLVGGAVMDVGEFEQSAKAILNVYLGGQEGGYATHNLLYGKVNPSGKLAETYPYPEDLGLSNKYFPMGPKSVEYRESVYVGYRYFDMGRKVRYPFGYGLSYTTFEYGKVEVSKTTFNEDEQVTVRVKVKNTGKTAGSEIVQLYVTDDESTVFRPKQELKGFTKLHLDAGEEKEAVFTLDSRAFAYYNTEISGWHVESGTFTIKIGASSRDIKGEVKVNVKSLNENAKMPRKDGLDCYYDLKDEISEEQFKMLGAKVVGNEPYKVGTITENTSLQQSVVSRTGRFLYNVITFGSKIVAIGAENPEMITRSVKDMPLRSLCNYTGGVVPEESVQGIVDMCNRKKGGFKRVVKGFFKRK